MSRFPRLFTRAKREGMLALVAKIRVAAQQDWRATAWLPERMYPQCAKRTISPGVRLRGGMAVGPGRR